MEKDKNWFITQYRDIHENLSNLENEVQKHLLNKEMLINDYVILQDLQNKVNKQIERLEKIRKYERETFKYND